MSTYFPTDHTAAEWDTMARDASTRSAESFERSDTDGFMSQWAGDTCAAAYRACARVAADGGTARFRMLADTNGTLLDAREVRTRYGYAWAIDTADGTTTWFSESQARDVATRVANNAKKGYRFVAVERPAVVTLAGSSPASVHPVVLPKRGSKATVVGDWADTDDGQAPA